MTKRKAKSAAKARRPKRVATPDALGDLRGKIDALDEQIQSLIAERARFAKEIGVLKGLTQTADFYRPEREAQVLRRVVERNRGAAGRSVSTLKELVG